MSKEKDKSHLVLEDRVEIAAGLAQRKTATDIAVGIGCAKTTVSREVKRNFIVERKGAYGKSFNDCANRTSCRVAHECLDCSSPRRNSCAYCSVICCSDKCSGYAPQICSRLGRFPFVCNGCEKMRTCTLEKHIYSPNAAQKKYEDTLSSSREILHVTEGQVEEIEATLKSGLDKGQSINHIFSYAGDALPICQRTAYNYIDLCIFKEVRRIDQPKAVKFKKRSKAKPRKEKRKSDSAYLKGRMYADFLVVISDDGHPPVVEMDCVEGTKGGNGKVLLTLLFRSCSLQIAFVLENQDTANVTGALRALRDRIGTELFGRLFPIILTDRGSEFADPESIEAGSDGIKTTSVYFCPPNSPESKPFCERNHSEIRRIFRHGRDVDFDQETCSRMMDNINSYSRAQYHCIIAFDEKLDSDT